MWPNLEQFAFLEWSNFLTHVLFEVDIFGFTIRYHVLQTGQNERNLKTRLTLDMDNQKYAT